MLYLLHSAGLGQAASVHKITALPESQDTLIPIQVSQRYGYIDQHGIVRIKPIFREVGCFVNGLARAKQESNWGFINTKGQFEIPGIYDLVSDFSEGLAQVDLDGKPFYIDRQGNKPFACIWSGISDFRNGEAIVSIGRDSAAIIDKQGHYVKPPCRKREIQRKSTEKAPQKNFEFKKTGSDWMLADKHGNTVGKETYHKIDDTGFEDGLAIVSSKKAGNWGVIDTTGKWIIAPAYLYIRRNPGKDKVFFIESERNERLTETDSDTLDEEGHFWGVDDYRGYTILRAGYKLMGKEGMHNGIVYAEENKRYGFIDRTGDYFWQAPKDSSQKAELPALDTDIMLRGYFYAYSSSSKNGNGWYESHNTPRSLDSISGYKKGTSGIVLNHSGKKIFKNQNQGIEVIIYNSSDTDLICNASDSRLYMKVQAKNKAGKWCDIEYLPSSWCGNSYHTVSLKPKEYWSFVAPVYTGSYKIKLRIELAEVNTNDKDRTGKTLYSEEFEGSINPAQFWNREGHIPRGLMDPYNE
jgi:hypothetical protein